MNYDLLYSLNTVDEQMAYSAGFDCGKYGANYVNCHFKFFTTPELRDQWEAGKAEGLKEAVYATD